LRNRQATAPSPGREKGARRDKNNIINNNNNNNKKQPGAHSP
jgi:hypothetical protein